MFPSIIVSAEFRWPVSIAGYSLRTVQISKWYRSPAGYMLDWDEHGIGREIIGRRHGDRVIVEKKAKHLKHQTPLSDPALFMKFAELECSEVAVLGFVSKYGYLSAHADERRIEANESEEEEDWDDGDGAYDFFGESLDTWYESIMLMKLGVQLWTDGRSETDRRFQKAALSKTFDKFLDESHRRDLRNRIGSVRTRRDALRIAHSIAIGEFDGGFGSPGLSWSFAEVLPRRRHVLQIAPDTLGTGLFLQFALAMAAESNYRRCEHCGGFFDGTTSRKSRKYCCDSCKTRAYNQRTLQEEPR
jgi:hypothetical protein